jgi:hypothetical protein
MSVLRRVLDQVRAVRLPFRRRDEAEVALPTSASVVAIQHPSATLPERSFDLVLIGAVLALLSIGTIEIYSATAADALTVWGSSTHFLSRQLLYVLIGGIAMWQAATFDYRRLKAWTYPLLLISILLLAVVLGMPKIKRSCSACRRSTARSAGSRSGHSRSSPSRSRSSH